MNISLFKRHLPAFTIFIYMISNSRRNLLRCGIAVISGGLAGCTSLSGSDESPGLNSVNESSSQVTAGESSGQTSVEDLNPAASVVTQASNESPAEIELTLKNTHTDSISVYPASLGTYPLEFLPPLSGEKGDVLLYPQDTVRVELAQGEFPESPVDGCWRVIDTSEENERDPYLKGQNLPKEVEIAPDETYSVLHKSYYRDPDSHCFPADTYETTTGIEFGEEERTAVDLTYILEVSSEEDFEISVKYGK